MFSIQRTVTRLYPTCTRMSRMCHQLGEPGSGAGRGGGGGGSIREAGGAFGRMEAAREEEYFYKKQKAQLKKLHDNQIDQAKFHEEQIKEHEAAIARHKEFLQNVKK